ncbi:LAFE_0B12772g1_1 [Lachancea fermentati]|uniref:LAFE_0B12772g1_1 n=1 Tax=Lachancea fermentati TaxID=4955 RepID=A0A1G4M965_LACFM|nr:LAFE_0B12772g1_1 [Lachancea fermentati]
MCWSDRPAKGEQSLRAMAQEALAFSEALIPPTEYREELETCAEYGVCAYLVRFAVERSIWLGRYREVYKNYHGLLQRRIEIKRSVTERMMDVGIKRSYNKMWEKLADQKMDILAFFNADSQETCKEMWSARQGELVTIMRERRKHIKLPWQTEYFFTDGYLDAQLENRAMVDFVYQEARDVQRRRDPPRVRVTWEMYVLMQFGIFFRRSKREAVYSAYPELPRVTLFVHWLRLMSVKVHLSNNQGVPLYIMVGEMLGGRM